MEHIRVCREEEELTFPREREARELLSLSDGIPACSMMQVTAISGIADSSALVEAEKTTAPWPMAHQCRAGFLAPAPTGVHGPSITGEMSEPCLSARLTTMGTACS